MTITIRMRENDPLLVEGDFTIIDPSGNEVPIVKKALCRCGASTMKPFCDGTHSKIGFQGAAAAVEKSESGSGSSST